MESNAVEIQDKCQLYSKLAKVLTLKVAQIAVQSRQGTKVTHQSTDHLPEATDETAPQWFNVYVPSDPNVTEETRRALGQCEPDGAVCIEISLRTTEGAHLVLETWAVRGAAGGGAHGGAGGAPCSPAATHARMTLALKAALCVSRVTPAYRLARARHHDTYTIHHRIYAGEPDYQQLGSERKLIRVSSVRTWGGALLVELCHRTCLALPAAAAPPLAHRTHTEQVDLTRPLRAAAFVDVEQVSRLTARAPASRCQRARHLSETSVEQVREKPRAEDVAGPTRFQTPLPSQPVDVPPPSRPIDVPLQRDSCTELMEFPFASDSPMRELASFYQRCASGAGGWRGGAGEGDLGPALGGATLAAQLRECEAALPEFDELVASMHAHAAR